MDDLINREELIEAFEVLDWYHIGPRGNLVHGANGEDDVPLYKYDDVCEVIKKLPSVEPEQEKVSRMTLYEMLDVTKYYQEVWIFETNTYDQNMPIFKGSVKDARKDTDHVWDYLMCEVEHYDCTTGILDIRVKNEYYEERLEGHYFASKRWGRKRNERPWLFSAEIDSDREEKAGEQDE